MAKNEDESERNTNENCSVQLNLKTWKTLLDQFQQQTTQPTAELNKIL